MALLMMTVMICMSVAGCGSSSTSKKENETKKEEDTSNSGGTVKLKIWAEEANWEVTNKMIESFKAKYKNEATFEIELIQVTMVRQRITCYQTFMVEQTYSHLQMTS